MKRKKVIETLPEKNFFLQATREQIIEFFREEIKELFWVEKHHHDLLLRLNNELTCPVLTSAFEKQAQHTHQRLGSLKEIVQLFGFELRENRCEAVEKLLQEGKSILVNDHDASMQRDICLVFVTQKITHFKLAMYRSLCLFSEGLCNEAASAILKRIVSEENGDDRLLTSIAEKTLFFEVVTESA